MFNLFRRRKNDVDVAEVKKKHQQAAKRAGKIITETNKTLNNGFAIKVYRAKGGDHASS